MGLLTSVRKVFAGNPPAVIEQAALAQGMGPATAFSPGQSVQPYDGYGRVPRAYNFTTGVNINSRPRSSERISFDTLRGLVDAYDIAQACIWHRIDSVRSLEWTLVPRKGVTGDLTDQIDYAQQILARPDRQTPFTTWIAPLLYDILAFDAGALSRIRNNAGRCIGLEVVDGTTIAPMIDGWGRTPEPPAEAYVQYANGVPWVWLTTDDLIYQPFRLRSNSPYGLPPLETILLNANTDLRFQAYFLQRFTDGNVPAAFATAPESWTPNQINDFQATWDAWMLGEQGRMGQVRFVPGGMGFAWSDQKEFTDVFSLFLMRKTCAAFSVTPTDMGFTETVNKSSGDTQADVQFRIGDLPLIQHVQGILSRFVQDDLGFPLDFQFDTGRETEDRLATAQANDLYIKNGTLSISEVREGEFGLTEPDGAVVPRFIFSEREGPIPLSSLDAVAGPTDADTGAPLPGAPLPTQVFQGVQGVIANPPEPVDPLAVQENGPSAIPPAPISAPVAKAAIGHSPAEANAERLTFIRFAKARARDGKWRDFEFQSVEPWAAAVLNARGRYLAAGMIPESELAKSIDVPANWREIALHRERDVRRASMRKASGLPVAAGIAVQAADTGRVLMLQRALDPTDPASGTWEFPGGHIEDGEDGLAAAWREWQEETGCPLDATSGQQTGGWASGNGIYAGFVWTVPSETAVPVFTAYVGSSIANPDDPDGDTVEAVAWFDPQHLPGNPALRAELAADLNVVLPALGVDGLVKATADKDPKVGTWRDGPADTPHARFDLPLTDHYAPLVQQAISSLWTDAQLRAAAAGTVTKASPVPPPDDASEQHLEDLIRALVADGILAGAHAAELQVGPGAVVITPLLEANVDWSAWQPGHPDAAALMSDGAFAQLLDDAGVTVNGIVGTVLDDVGDKIAAGLDRGLDVDTIADSLRDLVDDSARAERISHTEVARAMTQASLNVYQVNGISQWDLITSSGACPVCEGIAAANPHPLSDTADAAPVHPYCRCAVAPNV